MRGRPVPYGSVINEILLLNICHICKWHKFKILGIWFTNDLKECEVLNFSDKFSEIRAFVQSVVKETNNTTRQSSSSKIVDLI